MSTPPLNEEAMAAAREKLNELAKPPGSLGYLEDYAVRLAGIRGRIGGVLDSRRVLVFAADNGIYAQGFSPVPQATTALQAAVIADGQSGVGVLASLADASVIVYNVGVREDVNGVFVHDEPLMRGTKDMTEGPAIPERSIVEKALSVGADAVTNAQADIVGLGEMGICNTATASAVASVLLELPVRTLVGRGIGITDEQYVKKVESLVKAVQVNQPDPSDPLDVLQKVGGLDIAAMTGAYLQAARERTPVVIDGYISACAALCAARLDPDSIHYMFASHASAEPGFAYILRELGLHAPLNLGMRLGEGSGCPLMFLLLDASLRIIDKMATLEQVNLKSSQMVDMREIS